VQNGFSIQVRDMQNELSRIKPITITTGLGQSNGYFNELYYNNQNIIPETFVADLKGKINPEDFQFIWEKRMLDMHILSTRRQIEERLLFQPMPDMHITKHCYELCAGKWPDAPTKTNAAQKWPDEAFEIMLVVDSNLVPANVSVAFDNYKSDISFDDFLEFQNGRELELVSNNDFYELVAGSSAIYRPKRQFTTYGTATNAKMRICGIIRAQMEHDYLKPGLAYTDDLYEFMQEIESQSAIATQQAINFSLPLSAAALYDRQPATNPVDQHAILKMLGAERGVFAVEIYSNNLAGKNNILRALNEFDGIKYVDEADIFVTQTLKQGNAFIVVLEIIAIIALASTLILFFGLNYRIGRERTREMGILRAFGTSRGSIREIMLLEISFVGLCAGFLALFINVMFIVFANPYIASVLGLVGSVAVLAWWHPIAMVAFGLGMAIASGIVPIALGIRTTPMKAILH
jgi:ABC-type antimicrobial peptide transport system permease subunit